MGGLAARNEILDNEGGVELVEARPIRILNHSPGVDLVTRRNLVLLGALGLLLATGGCSDAFNAAPPPIPLEPEATGPETAATDAPAGVVAERVDPSAKGPILRTVIQLIRNASTNPGGNNFDLAAENLNRYFEGTTAGDFRTPSESRAFLTQRFGMPPQAIATLEAPGFTQRDGRHIEDCLLYKSIADRIGGDGDDLTRVRRVFDWVVRQVQLVPAGSLAPPGAQQARSRPFDVLLRGQAVEQGDWAERSWVFMALCRQLGVDAGIVVVTRPRANLGPMLTPGPEQGGSTEVATILACAAAIGDKAYLFDVRSGLAIPGPDGKGVATLSEAVTDPEVLDRMVVPGYPAGRFIAQSDLQAGRFTILIDSSFGYISGRMRLLQRDLKEAAIRDRMALYRDIVEQEAAFARAIGPKFAGIRLWSLPIETETLLFTDPAFVRAAQFALQTFDARFPLMPARVAQLRGDLGQAIESYVNLRFKVGQLQTNKRDVIPPNVQHDMDMYATYFLGLAQLDQARSDPKYLRQAETLFQAALRDLPEPVVGGPPWALFQYGASTNLGLLYLSKGDFPRAARFLARPLPTGQYHGNLVLARDLIWRDPTAIAPAEPEIPRPESPPGQPEIPAPKL